ncbi:MAG TPA: aspartate kinase, partial [Clostridiales bacterium]|nr:aspartate kinase [Clostridiales bacterium]
MGIKVAKFGGSSVADAIQLAKVRDIVQADSGRRYIVVSAPGKRFIDDNKITDLLYLCKTHIDHNIGHEQVFQVICDRFRAIEFSLGMHIDMESEFESINQNIREGASIDYIVSRGEYLTAILMAGYLGYDFVDTAELIKFDEKGRFLDKETDQLLKEELAKHERAVLPGFYGSDSTGRIRTFSRGGSDITGALVARAVKADVYENWTDVSGFLMADPKIVDNPQPIETVSYIELRELSYMGASVLHEDAIFPAKSSNIPINIRNTNEPDHPGTTIVANTGDQGDKIITGIAGSKDFIVIAIYKNMMNSEVGFVRRCLGVLEDYGVVLEHIPSSIDTISLVVSKKKMNGKLDEVMEELKRRVSPD